MAGMGELAGLLTSFFWSLSSVFFTKGGRQIGSINVNRIRLVFAVLLVMLAHQVTQGSLIPLHADAQRWLWLGLSGFAGLVLGDSFTFQAYVMVGNRLGTLMSALSPVIGALIAWIFLGEKLALIQVGGILLSISGVILVVLKCRDGNGVTHDRRRFALGILCGLGGAIGQATGLVLAKKGLAGDFPAVSGLVMRMLVSLVLIWLVAVFMGQIRSTLEAARNPIALRAIAAGAVVGPFIGVWLSLLAVQLTYVGVASTLTSLAPIFVLPINKFVFKEEVTRWAVIGTLIALSGVAVLFLFN
jgi:drug/metabolite transporter (DMT)-like permease